MSLLLGALDWSCLHWFGVGACSDPVTFGWLLTFLRTGILPKGLSADDQDRLMAEAGTAVVECLEFFGAHDLASQLSNCKV